MGKFVFGKRSNEKLSGVEPEVKELCELALKFTKIDFGVIDGLRTAEEQQTLYKQGKTELDGFSRKSCHQSGKAVDVIPISKEYDIWNVDNPHVAYLWLEVYRAFMRASKKLGLQLEFGVGYNISGGRDYPHISVL